MKGLRVASALGVLLQPNHAFRTLPPARLMHKTSGVSQIPSPIPLVPDVETFLKVIGRGLSQHVAKFPTWEALFSLTSPQLKELGIEPPRTRRYLLRWCQNFRKGQFGPGGDFQHVENGSAELKVETVQQDPIIIRRHVVNVPAGKTLEEIPQQERVRVKGFKVKGVRTISGPYAIPEKKYAGARVTVTEGMWEDKRGHKIDGGERRQKEVRFLRRVAERRAERERMGLY